MSVSTQRDWPTADPGPPPGEGEVQVWKAHAPPDRLSPAAYASLLDAAEKERAARFRFDRDRNMYTLGRSVLRKVLGVYLDVEPTTLRFSYNEHGKPALAHPESRIAFNMSHAHHVALWAFALGRPIGVDVEYIHRSGDLAALAERFFSPAEAQALRALPVHDRRTAFFHGWTRKEAYLKARGTGVTLGLDRFEVSLAPSEPARLIRAEGTPGAETDWSLRALEPEPDYIGAVAVQGDIKKLRLFEWRI